MKKLLCCLACLLAGTFALAEDQPREKKTDPGVTSTVEKKAADADRKKTPQASWPRPYSPTEEVRADSVVPFPTDI